MVTTHFSHPEDGLPSPRYRPGSPSHHYLYLLPALLFLFSNTALLPPPARAQTHFNNCLSGTGNIFNVTVVVPAASTPRINGTPLASGSEIAVFSEANPGLCAGVVTWNGTNTAITVWGDDPDTATALEGLVEGERMLFRVWDASTDTEYGGADVTVSLSFAAGTGRDTSGRYHNDAALYVLASLSVTTASPPAEGAIGEAGRVSVAQSNANRWPG